MNMKPFFLLAVMAAAAATTAHADIPEYATIELQARSNLIVNDNGWNVPAGTSFNSISPAINDSAQVAFTAGVVPIDGNLSHSGAGLWRGGHAMGEFVVIHDPGTDPDATMLISDTPSINAGGDAAYYTSLDGGTYQLWNYDNVADESTPVTLIPLTPTSIANPVITDDGRIGFKGRFGSGYGIALASGGTASLFAYDSNVSAGSPYAYIYSPDTSDDGTIFVKLSTSTDFASNEIRAFTDPGESTLVVANNAVDSASPFAGFDNGLAVSRDGRSVAVAVKLVDGNARAIYRFTTDGDGGYDAMEIARVEAAGTIRGIDYFAPTINDAGLVAFRAQDVNGQAIYVGDGTSLVRVAGNGDVVSTDLGIAQLGQHDSSPVFSGKPAINANGDIAFVAGVYPEGDNQTEWGSGVFVAYASPTIDDTIFVDGFDS